MVAVSDLSWLLQRSLYRVVTGWQLDSKTEKVPSLFPGWGIFTNKWERKPKTSARWRNFWNGSESELSGFYVFSKSTAQICEIIFRV